MPIPGTNHVFSLDAAGGGALTDISQYLKSAKPARSRDSVDVTTYGQSWKAMQALLMGGQVTLEGVYGTAIDTILNACFESTQTLTYQSDPQGTGSGKPRLTGECWVTAYDINPPVNDVETFSATLQFSGACTRSLQS